jgi:serine/threonine-protein kinase
VSAGNEPLFAGKFRLLRLLGKGAMGEVWLAEEEGPRSFRRRVAVKRLLAAGEIDEYATQSFVAEAQVIARLDHPNIVRLVELGSFDGALFLVLDFVDGAALDKVLKGGPLSAPTVAYLGREIARALQAVHALCDDAGTNYGVVHRDVTPSNILLARSGRVLLTDFGVARISGLGGDRTEAGVFKGKLPYMPPEQARGEPFDGRADLFSLAITLFESLIGRRIRKAETQTQLILQVANDPVPRVRAAFPSAPPILAMAIDRATATDPEDRFAHAGELAAHLDEALRSFGPGAEQSAREEILQRIGSIAAPPAPTALAMGTAALTMANGRRPEWSVPLSAAAPTSPITGSGSAAALTAPPAPAPPPPPRSPNAIWTNATSEDTRANHRIEDPETNVLTTGTGRIGSASVTAFPPPPRAGSRTAIFVGAMTTAMTIVAGALVLVVLRRKPPAVDHVDATVASAPAVAIEIASASASASTPVPVPEPTASASAEPAAPTTPVAPRNGGGDVAAGPGTLQVVALPWANVTVDGRAVGATPIAAISLAAGPHSVVLQNSELGVTRSFSTTVRSGKLTTLKVNLKGTK